MIFNINILHYFIQVYLNCGYTWALFNITHLNIIMIRRSAVFTLFSYLIIQQTFRNLHLILRNKLTQLMDILPFFSQNTTIIQAHHYSILICHSKTELHLEHSYIKQPETYTITRLINNNNITCRKASKIVPWTTRFKLSNDWYVSLCSPSSPVDMGYRWWLCVL